MRTWAFVWTSRCLSGAGMKGSYVGEFMKTNGPNVLADSLAPFLTYLMETISRSVWVLGKPSHASRIKTNEQKIRRPIVNLQQSKALCTFRYEIWWRYRYLWMDQVDSVWDSLLVTPSCCLILKLSPVFLPIHFHDVSPFPRPLHGYLLLGLATFW